MEYFDVSHWKSKWQLFESQNQMKDCRRRFYRRIMSVCVWICHQSPFLSLCKCGTSIRRVRYAIRIDLWSGRGSSSASCTAVMTCLLKVITKYDMHLSECCHCQNTLQSESCAPSTASGVAWYKMKCWCWESIAIILTRLWLAQHLRNCGQIPGRGKRFFSSSKCPVCLWGPQTSVQEHYPQR